MKRVAIILARGGSKRLPRKNIREFHGKPILHYPIAAARAAGIFDEVVVSTDDPEITRIAIEGGVHQVIHRPAALANDTATTSAAMAHAVGFLVSEGAALEHACCMYPCTPLVRPEDLRAGYNQIIQTGRCYVFPVVNFDFPPQRMLRMDPDGRVNAVWPQFDNVRNQDLEARWHDAGQWYWGSRDAWLNQIPIYGAWSGGMPMPRARAIDVDTEDDWRLAEALYFAERYPNTARGEA